MRYIMDYQENSWMTGFGVKREEIGKNYDDIDSFVTDWLIDIKDAQGKKFDGEVWGLVYKRGNG